MSGILQQPMQAPPMQAQVAPVAQPVAAPVAQPMAVPPAQPVAPQPMQAPPQGPVHLQQVGLPHQAAGLAPVLQNPSILPYGATSVGVQQDQRAMNPINRTEVQDVVTSARKRANEHIRQTNPTDWQSKIYQPHETIPELLILIEALTYTLEPKRTDVLRHLKDMQIAIAVYVPTGFADPQTGLDPGRGLHCQWRRSFFEFVPYEARKVPIHVAIMLLNQIRGYKHSVSTVTYTDPASGRMHRRQELLTDLERPQLGFLPFREITAVEQAGITDHATRFNNKVSRVRGPSGQGDFLLSMSPRQGGQPVAQPQGPPVQQQFSPPQQPMPQQPQQMQPPPIQQVQQAPPVQAIVQHPQQAQPEQLQPQQFYQQPPPGPAPQTHGPMGEMKTSVPLDRTQNATPVSEVTESTSIPQTNAAAVMAGLPAA